jgi:hypothetical protein
VLSGADLDEGQPCIVKIVKRHTAIDMNGEDAADRLRNEWAHLNSLAGTAIVPRPLGFDIRDDWGILVLKQLAGETLLRRVSRIHSDQTATRAEMIRIVANLVSVLKQFHGHELVNGDISPANIFVGDGDSVAFIDLESACHAERSRPLGFATKGYASPSVLAGAAPQYSDDLYSLGATIFFVATGLNLATVTDPEVEITAGRQLVEPWGPLISILCDESRRELTADVLDHCLTLLGTTLNSGGWATRSALEQVLTTAQQLIPTTEEEAPAATEEVISRECLIDLASTLMGLADLNSDGLGIWNSARPGSFGDSFRDFYHGDAGIAFALLRLGLASQTIAPVEFALLAAEKLWHSRPIAPDTNPGLLIGEAGAGLLFLTLGHVLGEEIWIDRAAAESRFVARMPWGSPDLLHGSAGRGLFHLWMYSATTDAEHLRYARDAEAHILHSGSETDYGPLWVIPSGYGSLSNSGFWGLAHGAAGIGYFLAELNKALGVEPTPLLGRIATALEGASLKRGDTLDWPDGPHGVSRRGVWCHGSSGVAQFFLRKYEQFGAPADLSIAVRALQGSLRTANSLGPTQCHGLAGLLETCLDFFSVTQEHHYLRVARRVAAALYRRFLVRTDSGRIFCCETPEILSPEFMVGSAGPAAALARMRHYERIGSFLTRPSDAFRTSTPSA